MQQWWSSYGSFNNLNSYDNIFTVNGTTAAIPEPVTWALFGSGLAALALVRRRTRKLA